MIHSPKVRWKSALSVAGLAGVMAVGGAMHFVATDEYASTVPGFLPWKTGLVYVSGVVEVACGVALIPRRTRIAGAWLTILVLVLIFPANIKMAFDGPRPNAGLPFNSAAALWLRLPLQGLLIAGAYSFTKPRS